MEDSAKQEAYIDSPNALSIFFILSYIGMPFIKPIVTYTHPLFLSYFIFFSLC